MRKFLESIGLHSWLACAPALLILLAGCGGRPSGGSSLDLVVNAVNYGASPVNYGASQLGTMRPQNLGTELLALTGGNTNNGAPNGVPSMGILSGPPLAMKVYLQQIALTQDNAAPTVLYSSNTAHTTDSGIAVTGCELLLTSGSVDLSACPGLGQLTLPAGTYTGTTATFAEVGEIQGCLNGTFSSVTTSANTVGEFTYPPPFPQTPIDYTTDAVSPGTTYMFCTRKDKHYYLAETESQTLIGSDADFSASNSYFSGLTLPDFVSIDLSAGNFQAKTMAQLEAGSVTLTSAAVPTAQSPTLTLAIDMNRMLEFFANVRSDFNPPNPSMHTGTSYFFTGKFTPVGGPGTASAVTFFAGAVGSVQGYQWTATGISGSAAGWFTLFLDASGNFLGGTMYEDDDNELTIMKGNARITSGTLATGATLTMDIAGTCAGFTTTELNGSGTCSLTAQVGGSPATFDVSYTRLL